MTRRWQTALILLMGLVAQGCATRIYIEVDSLHDSNTPRYTKYVILPGDEYVRTSDLQFKEFAHYIERAMTAKGYERVESVENAELAVLLNYGIGKPRANYYSYSLPVYGQTGGGTSTFSATTHGYGGTSTTTGTVYQTPTYGVVGSRTVSGHYVTYDRFLLLEAVDLSAYRQRQKIVPLWKTTAQSTGSSGDLRYVFPYLVVAIQPHIGTNTQNQVPVTLFVHDRRVKELKAQASQ